MIVIEFFDKLTYNIKQHDRIILMTHSTPDLDGLGSAIAFSELLNKMGKENYIVAPKNLINKSLNKAIKYLEENYIIPFKYEKNIESHNDLLIIFDVENSKLLECENLLKIADDKIVIDHHSIGSNKISNTVCEYINEEKSSTVEIVMEYLKYINIKLDSRFYTVLFAGLYVDTDGFNFKTTEETFEIASYLIHNGADLKVKQEFLKEPIEVVAQRYKYMMNSIVLDDNIYLCVIDDRICSNITVAKLAEEMLKFENVEVSFAVGTGKNSEIFVSARSAGEVDVSKIMLKMGGGGRHSLAATVIENNSIEDVIEKIKKIVRGN